MQFCRIAIFPLYKVLSLLFNLIAGIKEMPLMISYSSFANVQRHRLRCSFFFFFPSEFNLDPDRTICVRTSPKVISERSWKMQFFPPPHIPYFTLVSPICTYEWISIFVERKIGFIEFPRAVNRDWSLEFNSTRSCQAT